MGGAVRDALLGRPCHDFDLEIHGCGPKQFEALMHALGAKGVGKSFFVYKYKGIDIALPRTEKKIAKGHRGFAVDLAGGTQQASIRRDFTINALLYDLDKERIIDHFGGIEDIIKKRLRVVNAARFQEDSLRVLRAMRFAAQLGFKIDRASIALMRDMDLSDLSGQRITNELEKMFAAPHLHYGLYYLLCLQISDKLLGCTLTRPKFVFYAKKLASLPKDAPFYDLLFVYHTRRDCSFDRLKLPNRFKPCFTQPLLPKTVTKRYVAGVATRYRIDTFLGNYSKKVIQYAKRLHVNKKKFQALNPKELINTGYSGKQIGRALQKANRDKIRTM